MIGHQKGHSKVRKEHPKGYGKGVLEQVVSFFFTNFPDDWRSGEMWKAFIRCGRAIDVYVAKKKDKWGQSFGFVRFLEVKNIRGMEIKLNQIKVGQRTIQANVARFSNAEDQIKQKSHSAIQHSNKPITVSYAEAVINGRRNHAKAVGLEVLAEEEDLKWLKDCFVGIAKRPEIISTLQDKFLMEGYFSAKVTPMGGKLVLLSSIDHEELKDLVEQGKDWLAQRFSDVRPWTPTEVASERFTWLRCQGEHSKGLKRSISEEWSDESNGDFHEDGKWDSNWQVAEEDDEVQQFPGMAELAPAESERSMNMSMEEVKISEKIYRHEGSLNAVCQNSNSLAADEEPEVNGREATSDNTLKSADDKRGGIMKISRDYPNTCSQPNQSPSPRQISCALGQSRLNQFGVKSNGSEKGLEDLPMMGRKFTWFKSDGSAMSRLDRFLVSTGFLLNFPDLIQKGLSRDISDHCPVMLISSSKDWGPKPFRTLDCWFELKEFCPFVQEKWKSYNVEGWNGFRLKEKFKMLKNDLKEWNREVFGHIDRKLEKIRGEIKKFDDIAENGGRNGSRKVTPIANFSMDAL
ncbi:hypothetical protein SLEP1_g36471 [Rubroshorea leprosula]|uniref:RRM domain-containing protein n=1 Tax=Rubroshorea leprosula TaxID=152421 RepID=A0AAV5KRV4_9ROSI|nr:hypothetical protein SLEP1_g36471 [Rubroshorea leprosula]